MKKKYLLGYNIGSFSIKDRLMETETGKIVSSSKTELKIIVNDFKTISKLKWSMNNRKDALVKWEGYFNNIMKNSL